MWGVNYWTDSFRDRSGITAQPVAAEDLKNVTAYFAERLSKRRTQCRGTKTASTRCRKSKSPFRESVGLRRRDGAVPLLEFPDTGVKAVRCSRIMSVMGFTGVYFACVGESNVNVDSPACLLPLHHRPRAGPPARHRVGAGCNFSGRVGLCHPAGCRTTYIPAAAGIHPHLGNALYETDPEAYWAIRGTLPAAVETDLRDNSAYWDQFRDNVVEKVSDTVYDAALKSYGDANGMKSYSMVVELLVAYYKDLI